MAGRRRKSSGSIFSMLMSCCSGGGDDGYWDEPGYVRRMYASDEDRLYWVAEPGIDRRAGDFITKFHQNSHI